MDMRQLVTDFHLLSNLFLNRMAKLKLLLGYRKDRGEVEQDTVL